MRICAGHALFFVRSSSTQLCGMRGVGCAFGLRLQRERAERATCCVAVLLEM